MGAADWLGLYGATVATAVAAIQFIQWNQSRKPFIFAVFGEVSIKGKSQLVVSITNNMPTNLYINRIFICQSHRKFPYFWNYRLGQAVPINFSDGIKLYRLDSKVLAPGDVNKVTVPQETIDALAGQPVRHGWKVSTSLVIHHSAHSRPFVKPLR